MNHLDFAKRIALDAGALIKSKLDAPYVTNEKSSSFDLVTEVDRAAEQLIRQRITEQYPGHAFLGEEESFEEAGGIGGELDKVYRVPFLWIVDPIDGTSNFVHQIPGFTVSIALACRGELVLGVIYDPSSGDLYWAEKGTGAYVNGSPITVSDANRLEQLMIGTGFPTDEGARAAVVECLGKLSPKCRSIRSMGSAALQLAYVASGKLGAYWEYGLSVWDTAAGVVLIQEAGGTVTDAAGQPFRLFMKNIVASNGRVQEQMLDHMKLVEA
ncbi:inositol monophosphatase family protein [Paenibacillus ehimensis]|uniref:Inositol-1-monophosphatase n=1 Tax=Paenibacillus ehimensis TaxID=79264 RepID=A0ABT8V5W5_9BACL|nr:inositol monophosphatase family protein [Paenibacillus ehimensis]MDO3676811.1 inositol monophosphatase family protein [Paenibacillus ehimensis]MEC0210398.1 inositol monophosphatase family protein [Paenibacillus ehimensis]